MRDIKIVIIDKFRGNLSLQDKYLRASGLENLEFNGDKENKEKRLEEEEKLLEKHKVSEVQEFKERLEALNFKVRILDFENEEEFYKKIKEFQPDLAINASEEKEIIFLEKNSIPYTGSNLETMILSSDKYKTKRVVKNDSLNIAEDFLVKSIEDMNIFFNEKINAKKNYIAKPNFGRGSAGICEDSIIRYENIYNKERLLKLKEHFKKIILGLKQPVLVEELISEGFSNDYNKENFKEVTVGVLGYERPKVLMPLEIRKKNSILTFDAKMNDNAEFIVPADIDSKMIKKLSDIAIKTYYSLKARDYLRIDLIVHNDEIYLLETNTAPGLMMNHLNNGIPNSYLGIMAEREGINLIEEIVKIARKRYNI
ncbi:MAG: hypothetical protein QXU20_03150 [Candidatus Woesearchaeota archaeon]